MSKSLSSTDNLASVEQLLNEYKHVIFDNLTDPEEAYDYVTSVKGEETIKSSIRDLFVRHGMCDKFGITLLHRHFDMDPSERLVSVGNTSVPWGPSDYNNKSLGAVIPQAFIFSSQDQIVPFEYTFFTNEVIGNATGIDAATKAFLLELRELLFSLKLEKVLGLRVFSGHIEGNYNVEFTIGRANIFVEVENPPKNPIPTSWYFNAQHATVCPTICVPASSGHYKKHKGQETAGNSPSPNLIECVA